MTDGATFTAGLYDLSGKVALVTGAQRGIGAVCAEMLARAGAEVVINYVVEPERAKELAADLSKGGSKAWELEFDVTSSQAVTGGFEEILARAGRLDIVVNNAGLRADNLALRMRDEDWRKALDVNLNGAFYCCRAALAIMRKSGGSIVNVSSVAAFTGSIGQANYAAAKAGVVGLTRSLAVEYAGRGIRVNCIVPGLVETEMTAGLSPAFREQFISRIPLKRFASPEEIATAVLFLASDAASYITGVALHVNGGGYTA